MAKAEFDTDNIIALDNDRIKAMLGERRRDSHKGDNGKGLLIAGSAGFSGAALMAAASALRAGIGTLKVLTSRDVGAALYALPEAMCITFGAEGEGWSALPYETLLLSLNESTCVGIGPGIGKDGAVERIVSSVMRSGKSAVIDADALNAIARSGVANELNENVVITPHIGEMSRLTGLGTDEIKRDMKGTAMRFAKAHRCTVVLKSDRSVIASHTGEIAINTTGNAGLAKGGSGDVLTGIILAMLGQKLAPFEAGCVGSYILGLSADNALELLRERALIARDVISAINGTCKIFDCEKQSDS